MGETGVRGSPYFTVRYSQGRSWPSEKKECKTDLDSLSGVLPPVSSEDLNALGAFFLLVSSLLFLWVVRGKMRVVMAEMSGD